MERLSMARCWWCWRKPGLGRTRARLGGVYSTSGTVSGRGVSSASAARPRAAPIAVGVVVLMAGLLQFTAWKARHLACCRDARTRGRTAWQHGLSLVLHCSQCCLALMAVLLVLGVMDLRAMAVVAAAPPADSVVP